MSKIISVHSFRGGTGKSNTTANVAALLANAGLRVGVVDTDIQSPGIHVLLGLHEEQMQYALNDFLCGLCSIEKAAYDVTGNLGSAVTGSVYLIPSSIKAEELTKVVSGSFDVRLLISGLKKVTEALNLDVLMIDTHPGLNEETLLSIATSDGLVIIVRPDAQDYQGTAVTVQVARKLDIKRMVIVANKVPSFFDTQDVRKRMEYTFNCEVVAVMPHSDEMMELASEGIFALRHPHHPLTAQLQQVVTSIRKWT
jgi:MinD-like ATPase involved in chromosome partitioning or flagellar assembly